VRGGCGRHLVADLTRRVGRASSLAILVVRPRTTFPTIVSLPNRRAGTLALQKPHGPPPYSDHTLKAASCTMGARTAGGKATLALWAGRRGTDAIGPADQRRDCRGAGSFRSCRGRAAASGEAPQEERDRCAELLPGRAVPQPCPFPPCTVKKCL